MKLFRVLVVTNLWPNEADPGYGSFVQAQMESLRPLGVEFEVLFIQGRESRWNYVRAITELRRRLKAKPLDLIHAHFGLSAWVARCQFRIPVIVSFMGDDVLGRFKRSGRISIYGRFLQASSFLLARIVSAVIVKSGDMKSKLRLASAHVIPNGVDPALFQPSAEARQSVRKELGISPDALLVGLVCRYHPQKDHPNFLRAAAILARKWPDVRFVLVGCNVDRKSAALTDLMRTLDLDSRMHLLGERNDMPRLTAALDIATSSSSYGEALALALAEAMSCEVPCVVTDVGDSALLVGETGVIVPPSNPEALADGLARLLSAGPEKRRELGKAARARAEEGYSIPNIVRGYEAMYSSLK